MAFFKSKVPINPAINFDMIEAWISDNAVGPNGAAIIRIFTGTDNPFVWHYQTSDPSEAQAFRDELAYLEQHCFTVPRPEKTFGLPMNFDRAH